MEAPAPPFPVFVVAYAINGFGIALQVRHTHIRCVEINVTIAWVGCGSEWVRCKSHRQCRNEDGYSPRGLRYNFATYQLFCVVCILTRWFAGLGALSSPLVATQFSQLPRWSFHYLTALGVAILDTIFLIIVFRFRTQDGVTGRFSYLTAY